jgi:hypothetical protein
MLNFHQIIGYAYFKDMKIAAMKGQSICFMALFEDNKNHFPHQSSHTYTISIPIVHKSAIADMNT